MTRMRKFFLLPFLLALVTLFSVATAKEANLLANGGFEEGLDGWAFLRNSGRATATLDRKTRKEGKQALHLAKTGGVPFDVLRRDIASVTPGARVTVSAQVKGKDVGNAFLKFWVYDQAGEPVIQDVDVQQLRGTFNWKKVEKTYDLPRNAASAAVMVLMVMGGDLWIDDLRVQGKEAAPPAELGAKTRAWLEENAVPLKTLRCDAPLDDLLALKETLADVRIVQLGEESHGDGPAFQAKCRLVKFLHEELGFDVLAFEAGLFECDRANAMLAEGKVRDAMFASVPGVWRVAETRPVFQHLADSAKGERPLRLAGWDLQATGGLALELPQALAALLGGDDRLFEGGVALLRETTEAIWNGHYAPTSKSRKALRAVLDAIEDAITSKREALVSAHGEAETALLERALENFRLWETSAAGPKKGKWDAVNARDARMADNFRWLAEVRYPEAKIISWGATMHFIHGAKGIKEGRTSPYRGCRPMGEATRKTFGKQVYTIGFAAHHGKKGTPFWGPFDIDTAPSGSIEDILHRYGEPLLFVDFRKRGPFHERLQAGLLGYNRAMVARWPDVIDGLVFTDENAPSSYVGDE